MKKLVYSLCLLLIVGCTNGKDLVYFQVTFETGNIKPDDILLKPLYQKHENQCGALFLDGKNLTVINNFDTSQTFINLKYKFEKNTKGLYDIYTFEDVFLKPKASYTVLSSLGDEGPVLRIKGKKIKILDKTVETIEKKDGSTMYIKKGLDADGKVFTEIYTIKKTMLSQVRYDQYSFPCE